MLVAPLLWRASLRYLRQHRWLLSLSVVGVALGVAVVVAIDLANSSARTAFALSSETVTGKTTHQIIGGGGSLPDSVYVRLRTTAGMPTTAPAVDGFAATPAREGLTFQVLGVDPLAEQPFRSFVPSGESLDLGQFFSPTSTGLISVKTAEELALQLGDRLPLDIEGVAREVTIGGYLGGSETGQSDAALANLLVVDINTAKQLFDMPASLTRIDVIASEEEVQQLRAVLPDGVDIVAASTRSETLAQMTRAFELNLSALSLLALVVGMFLTYNTMNFSVVQRRPLIGRMRALGVTRREVFWLVLAEALFIGAVGTLLGLLLGVLLGRGLVQLVTRTINDLYYVLSVREMSVRPLTLFKGIALGVGATLVSAWMPARSATRSSPSTVLRRSAEETEVKAMAPRLALVGLVLGLGGALLLVAPSRSIIISYAALFLVLIGFALLVPVSVVGITGILRPLAGSVTGAVGRMGVAGISGSLSRTSVAIAALMIAVAATIGVGVMVSSFRTTVVVWLNNVLRADVYIQPPNLVFRSGEAELVPSLVEAIRDIDGVSASYGIRHVEVMTSVGLSQLSATETRETRGSMFAYTDGDPEAIRDAFRNDDNTVLVSEAYAWRHGLTRGDSLTIFTDRGDVTFLVGGVYYDYASDQGAILIRRLAYENYFDDRGYSGLALYVADDRPIDEVIGEVQETAGATQQILVRSNRELRRFSLDVFDRTFTITSVLRLLAVVVAFVGVLSALMSLQLEREREFRVLRAVGLTKRQQRRYVAVQTGTMGAIAGALAIPLGLLLAWVLIFVINRRSFGWTLQMDITPIILVQAALLSIAAALLAGFAALLLLNKRGEADGEQQ